MNLSLPSDPPPAAPHRPPPVESSPPIQIQGLFLTDCAFSGKHGGRMRRNSWGVTWKFDCGVVHPSSSVRLPNNLVLPRGCARSSERNGAPHPDYVHCTCALFASRNAHTQLCQVVGAGYFLPPTVVSLAERWKMPRRHSLYQRKLLGRMPLWSVICFSL